MVIIASKIDIKIFNDLKPESSLVASASDEEFKLMEKT